MGTTATVSHSQRGHIYQCVQLWAQARIEHEQVSAATAFAGCWAALKTRYHVAKYEHIPVSHYYDCIAYMNRAYQKFTGQPFPEVTQEEHR